MMLTDLIHLFDFVKSKNGENIRKRIFFFLLFSITLLIINRFILVSYISDAYKVSYNQSKLLFQGGISPYGLESKNFLINLAEVEQWKLNNISYELENPIFQLIFLWPFTLIKNYEWSGALFMTINQVLILLSVHMLFNLLRWKVKLINRCITYLFVTTTIFVSSNFLLSNFAIFQFTLIIAALFFDNKRKPIQAGIFFGLALTDPISIFYILVLMIVIFIMTNRSVILIWSFITVFLLTILSFIFDQNWIVGWLKNLFLSPTRYPFVTYSEAVLNKYNFEMNRAFVIVPIILLSWVLYELLRTKKDNVEKKIWLLSVTGILNYYLMVQSNSTAEIFFLPSVILLISIWWEKINKNIKIILLPIFSSVSFFTNKLSLLSVKFSSELILFIIGLALIINLYWVRTWVTKPFDFDSDVKDIL